MHHSAPEIAEQLRRRASFGARFRADDSVQTLHSLILAWTGG